MQLERFGQQAVLRSPVIERLRQLERSRRELVQHLHEIQARIHVDPENPERVLEAMVNIEQYLRGVLPDHEEFRRPITGRSCPRRRSTRRT